MSVHYDRTRERWVVRWREAGRQRARRFASEAEARSFDARVSPARATPSPAEPAQDGAGVYMYETAEGQRWRFVFRLSDGRMTSRRGFTSRAAALAARAVAVEEVRRGDVRATRDTFGQFWARVPEAKRPYVTAGTLQDYTTHGNKRLLPWFGALKLAAVDEDRIRDWLAQMTELVADGEVSAKTINNARTCLSMTLGEAVRRRHIPQNPCRWVPELPVERTEIDYLRLAEIDVYLEACAGFYRPLAEFLIGTGARISEALGVRWTDVDLDAGVVRIARQRARDGDGTSPTKGKRFRSVQVGPRLAETLRAVRDERAALCVEDGGWLFICPPPPRGRYAGADETGAAESQDRARLARVGARGFRAPRHAAALAPTHSGNSLACDRPPADLRAATTRAPLDHDNRGALRAPGDVLHARGGGADRGADRGRRLTSHGVMIAFR
jgi:integrase